MSDETRLAELVDRWEDQTQQGELLPTDDFIRLYCEDEVPTLVSRLRKRIDALREMNNLLANEDEETGENCEQTATFKRNEAPQAQSDWRAGAEPIPGYKLLSPLGAGGFGEVWKAVGPGGFEVALKFVRLDRPAAKSELRALEFLRKLRHANLIATFGAWQRDGWLITAMELADRTLSDRLREATRSGKKGIPGTELLRYMIDAARGIDFLNTPRKQPEHTEAVGVQHRDIKPQNLLLVGGSLKVADFGIAQVLSKGLADHTGKMSVSYAAPEFFDHKTSGRSDQYSLAVTYCQLRGDRLPFEGNSLQVMKGHIELPPDLTMLPDKERSIVAKALSKQPEERWPTCREFIRAICELHGSRVREEPASPPPTKSSPISPRPERPSRTSKVQRSPRRIRWAVGLISAAVLILGVWQLPKLLTGDKPAGPTEPEPGTSAGADVTDGASLDGRSLAAGVDLRSKRSAEFKARLAKASKGFPASCIKATVGELRVGSRLPDGNVDVVIPVAVTVDAEKYKSFDESMRKVLRDAATKETAFAFEPVDIRAISKRVASARIRDRDLTLLRAKYMPFTTVTWDFPLYGYPSGSIHKEHFGDNYSESEIDYETCTIMLHDKSERDMRRTNWTAYDIDKEYLTVFAPSRRLVLDVKVRLIDAGGKTIAERSRNGRFPGHTSQPGSLEGFSAGGQIMDRLETNINLVDSGGSFSSYHMRVFPIGPFFSIRHRNWGTVSFSTELRFSMPFKIHVDELREVKRAECVLSLKPGTRAFDTD